MTGKQKQESFSCNLFCSWNLIRHLEIAITFFAVQMKFKHLQEQHWKCAHGRCFWNRIFSKLQGKLSKGIHKFRSILNHVLPRSFFPLWEWKNILTLFKMKNNSFSLPSMGLNNLFYMTILRFNSVIIN